MNQISVPRHIYKNVSIKTNCGNNKQSLKTQVLLKKRTSCLVEILKWELMFPDSASIIILIVLGFVFPFPMRGQSCLSNLIAFYDEVTSSVDGFMTLSTNNTLNTLTGKMAKYRLGNWIVRWTENCLNCQTRRVVISSTNSGWRPVTGVAPQGMILPLILFNPVTNDLDDGTDCTLGKCADSTKCGGVADAPHCCAAIWRDLNWLEKWAVWLFQTEHIKCNRIKKKKKKVKYRFENVAFFTDSGSKHTL